MEEQKKRLKVIVFNIAYIFMLMLSLNYRPLETSYPSMLVAFPGWVMIILYCCFYLDLIPLVVFNILLMKLESSKVQFIRFLSLIIPLLGLIQDRAHHELEIVKIIRMILTIAACIYFIIVIWQHFKVKRKSGVFFKTVLIVILVAAILTSSYTKEKNYYINQYRSDTLSELMLHRRILLTGLLLVEEKKPSIKRHY